MRQTWPKLTFTAQVRACWGRCSSRGTRLYRSAAHRGRPSTLLARPAGGAGQLLRRGLANLTGRRRRHDPRARRERVCQHDADPARGQPRSGPRSDSLPRQPRTRTARRARAEDQREAHARRAGPQRRHVERGLLLPLHPRGLLAAGPDARERLHLQLADRLRSRREHRLGNTLAGEPAVDRELLDGLAGAPRQHPERGLPRNRRRSLPTRTGFDVGRPGRRALHTGLRHDLHGEPRGWPRS
jgi:hypothetical protein